MTNKICSLCNTPYKDEDGHNYDNCVIRLTAKEENCIRILKECQENLDQARLIQKQTWWRK